jgi:hypothetical protein
LLVGFRIAEQRHAEIRVALSVFMLPPLNRFNAGSRQSQTKA